VNIHKFHQFSLLLFIFSNQSISPSTRHINAGQHMSRTNRKRRDSKFKLSLCSDSIIFMMPTDANHPHYGPIVM